ncbi:MAG TPA: AraC family transcriptional regulator [Polyangiaceae bacterium]|nr:AraC family transcriptional regulator [Polyangiaceae bacterium]
MSRTRTRRTARPAARRGLQVITLDSSFESALSTWGPFLLSRYALAWIVEGGGVTSLDDEVVVTGPGSVLSMLPGMSLRHDWGKVRSFQSFIVFDLPALPEGLPSPKTWPRLRQLTGEESFFHLWRYLLSVQHSAQAHNLLRTGVELLLRSFVSGLVDGKARTAPALPGAVERALDFMLARLARGDARFDLGSVARASGVTPQHLCRLFRRELDETPIGCGHLMRVEQAAGALERSRKTLAEIAESFGYSSAFHFSRVFKQVYGVPPSEYRRAFVLGKASRPGGLAFRHHKLRHYLHEAGPGRVEVYQNSPASSRSKR